MKSTTSRSRPVTLHYGNHSSMMNIQAIICNDLNSISCIFIAETIKLNKYVRNFAYKFIYKKCEISNYAEVFFIILQVVFYLFKHRMGFYAKSARIQFSSPYLIAFQNCYLSPSRLRLPPHFSVSRIRD